jgi:hypothetical protein
VGREGPLPCTAASAGLRGGVARQQVTPDGVTRLGALRHRAAQRAGICCRELHVPPSCRWDVAGLKVSLITLVIVSDGSGELHDMDGT